MKTVHTVWNHGTPALYRRLRHFFALQTSEFMTRESLFIACKMNALNLVTPNAFGNWLLYPFLLCSVQDW